MNWGATDCLWAFQDSSGLTELRIKDQKVTDIDQYIRKFNSLAPMLLKYRSLLNGMTAVSARMLPKYFTNFRPELKLLILNGATEKGPLN